MTDNDIIKRGYDEYKPSPFHSSGIVKCFQKRFDDDNGKRYFIDVHKWDIPSFTNSYEYSIQLYNKDTHDAIDLLFHSTWEIDKVEEFVKKLFETGMFDYYEEWD